MAVKMHTEHLFSYGTLQKEKVQLSTFGRMLSGAQDWLCGFKLTSLKITDPEVLRISEQEFHTILTYTGDLKDKIEGMVFTISGEELLLADKYEVEDYKRVQIQLESGLKAWVYVDVNFKGLD